MAWEYSEKTKQLFLDAVAGKPGTHLGEIENPDGIGEHGSIACGDALKFTFRVEKNDEDPTKDRIVETKYLTFGCTSAIAASEALCCILEDKKCTPIEALKVTNADIVEFLEGLPQQKIHCSVMGEEALQAAVLDWSRKRGVDLKALGIEIVDEVEEQEHDRIVCRCFSLTESYIRRKIKELNLRTIPEITAAIKAGGGCGVCHHEPGGLQDILDDVWGKEGSRQEAVGSSVGNRQEAVGSSVGNRQEAVGSSNTLAMFGDASKPTVSQPQPSEPIQDVAELSPYQFAKRIEQEIDTNIRPMLQKDGGDIEIIDIKGTLVYVTLRGACVGCAGATQTLKFIVEKALHDNVSDKVRVIQV